MPWNMNFDILGWGRKCRYYSSCGEAFIVKDSDVGRKCRCCRWRSRICRNPGTAAKFELQDCPLVFQTDRRAVFKAGSSQDGSH